MYRFQVLLFLFLLGSCNSAEAQISFGGSGLYNLQTESVGVGARVVFRIEKSLQVVPQFSYFLPFSKVNEWTVGLSIQQRILKYRNFGFYGLTHAGYNHWINFQDSKMKGAQQTNWNAELGAGAQWGRGVKFFAEWRYNVHFQEAHLQLGLIGAVKKGQRKKEKCAAYN
jgi:hypothetical protein